MGQPGGPNHHLTKLCPLQAKHLESQYWGNGRPTAVHRDPSLPYLEQYRVDASQFQELFASLTPWACGAHTPVLAGRMFRFLDRNKDSLINFKEFVTGMSEWLHCQRVPRTLDKGRAIFHWRHVGAQWGSFLLQPGAAHCWVCGPQRRAKLRGEQGAWAHSQDSSQRESAVRRGPENLLKGKMCK